MNLKYCVAILFAVLLSVNVVAQSQSYKDAMKKQLIAFNTAKGASDIKKAADGFISITVTEKSEWLAFYYAGLCNVVIAFEKAKTDIDLQCDKAEVFAKKADSLSKNNSEVFVLKSMISAARIAVNEKARGPKFGGQSGRYANEAIKLNADNPRAYLVKAQNVGHTPEAFGGGAKKAKAILETALEKEKLFKPETPLHPDWAKTEIDKELNILNASETNDFNVIKIWTSNQTEFKPRGFTGLPNQWGKLETI